MAAVDIDVPVEIDTQIYNQDDLERLIYNCLLCYIVPCV